MPALTPSLKRIAIVAILVVLVAVAVFTIPRLLAPDFRKELAAKLGVDEKYLHLNIPPAAKREPGFTFMMKGSLIPIMFPPDDAEDLVKGESFDLEWATLTKSDSSGGVTAGILDSFFSQESRDKISLRAIDCRILELSLDRVRARLLASDDVVRAVDSKAPVLVVIRAYQGRLEMKVKRDSKTSGEVWTKKVEEAGELVERAGSGTLGIESTSDREMILAWQIPTVFAYEAMEAKLLASHLDPQPNKVEFRKVAADELAAMSDAQDSGVSPKKNRLEAADRILGPLQRGANARPTLERG